MSSISKRSDSRRDRDSSSSRSNDSRQKSPLIIGFCGFSRCGKDTACEHIVEKTDMEKKMIYSFGDALRKFAIHLDVFFPEIGMYYNEIINKYGYEEAKNRFPSFRKHLVRIGDGARESISQSIWLNAVKEQIDNDNVDLAVIKDVRYANEVEFIIKNDGIVVYIDRAGLEPANNTERKSIEEIITKFRRNPNFKKVKNDGNTLDLFYWNLFEALFELNQIKSDNDV